MFIGISNTMLLKLLKGQRPTWCFQKLSWFSGSHQEKQRTKKYKQYIVICRTSGNSPRFKTAYILPWISFIVVKAPLDTFSNGTSTSTWMVSPLMRQPKEWVSTWYSSTAREDSSGMQLIIHAAHGLGTDSPVTWDPSKPNLKPSPQIRSIHICVCFVFGGSVFWLCFTKKITVICLNNKKTYD